MFANDSSNIIVSNVCPHSFGPRALQSTTCLQLQAFGIPAKLQACAELKAEALAYIRHNHRELLHCFRECRHLSDGNPNCLVCPPDKCSFVPSKLRVSLVSGGPPCQPWSALRWKKGKGTNQKCPTQHAKYETVFEFIHLLEMQNPGRIRTRGGVKDAVERPIHRQALH